MKATTPPSGHSKCQARFVIARETISAPWFAVNVFAKKFSLLDGDAEPEDVGASRPSVDSAFVVPDLEASILAD